MTKAKHKAINRHIQHSTQAEHHLSMRFRSGKAHVTLIDTVIVFTGPLLPLAVFIQAYEVWILGRTEGLSIITWSLLTIASSTMAYYAVYHRTKPLMMTYIPLVIANALVVAGILIL